MSSTFRWGIIGTGGIAKTFLRDLALADGHEVVAVGSRTIEKARTFANDYGIKPLGSYEE
ncbi:MAG: hypothetical protein RL202_332, partial [Actinomycetota bacterium]